jgi:hypothetical protein
MERAEARVHLNTIARSNIGDLGLSNERSQDIQTLKDK